MPSAPAPASPAASHAPILVITSATFHAGEAGVAYASVGLAASGGLGAYSWSISGGALPGGLSIASSTVSGTPTAAGTFNFTVHVADTAGDSAIVYRAISIVRALAVSSSCASACVIGAGCTICGTFGSAAGGLPPYSYKAASGVVPKGMTLAGLALKGAFPQGSFALGVQVVDSLGAQAAVQANWSIYGPAALTKGGDCIDTVHYPPYCKVTWTYTGGSPLLAPKLVILGYAQYCDTQGICGTPATPPPGWSTSVSSGVVSIAAAGSGCVTNYLGTVRLALVDPSKCATTQYSNEADLNVELRYAC